MRRSFVTRYGFGCFVTALIAAVVSMPGSLSAQQLAQQAAPSASQSSASQSSASQSSASQSPASADPAAIERGHRLAVTLCAICHIAAPDQPSTPVLHPPAPPFATLARTKGFDTASLSKFLTTTHRGLDRPDGMPNPDLMDYQVKDVVAYFLSLSQK